MIKVEFYWLRFIVALAFLVAIAGFVMLRHKDPTNCSGFAAEHIYNIRKGTKYYQPKLDRDHDGVACER